MSASLAISLDAMGGDNAPEMVIRGADIARQRFPNAHFLFFGDEQRLKPMIDRLPGLSAVSTVRHAETEVKMDDKPSQALRAGRKSSMRLAIDAVRDGEAAAIVSAGNTGALMAMAKFVLQTLPGIDRPAIASFFPTMRGESVMLDLGANVECDADNLVQFAVMGSVFARTVLGVREPIDRPAQCRLRRDEGPRGSARRSPASCAQPRTCPARSTASSKATTSRAGTVDVVVTDGFTGNVALKTIEGTAKLYSQFLRHSFKSSLDRRARLPDGAAGAQRSARAARSAALQRRDLPGPQRHLREEPRRHRRLRLRQCDRRRGRHGRATASSRRCSRSSSR